MRFEHLTWPFFEDEHRALATGLEAWAAANLTTIDHSDVDRACRALVGKLGRDGWLRQCVPAPFGGTRERLDARSIALCRETLAYHDPLADFAFAMQGLGSGPIGLDGSRELRERYLSRVAAGEAIAAFALSEREAGSDVGAIATTAVRDGAGWRLDGEKTWISNGGIADFYVVFARSGEAPGTRGLSAFVVEPADPGFAVGARIEAIAPHPLATLRFDGCRVSDERRIGTAGEGFKLAMRTLDIFRTSVAGAALGMARRALDETLEHVEHRTMFGQHLADFQMTQTAIAAMATEIDAGRAARVPRRMDPRRWGTARNARSRDGQVDRDRKRAADDRSGSSALRRARRRARQHRRAALPRDPGAPHL